MAEMHSDTIAVENVSYGLADALYTIASKYTNRFSHEAGSNILTFDGCPVYFNDRYIGVKNGDEVAYNIKSAYEGCYYSPISVITLFGDTVFYFRFQWMWNGDNNMCALLFFSNGNNKLLGITTQNSYRQIEQATFIDLVSCNDATYSSQILFYISAAQYGYGITPMNILYSNNFLLINNSGNCLLIDELKNCSYIPLFSSLVINGKNYLAIGNYSLIEVSDS